MTAEQRRQTLTRWLRAGLDYRSWTVRETTNVLNEELIEDLYGSGQYKQLGDWLRLIGDKERLGALDRETMGQTPNMGVQPTPKLRGH